jgi:beta-phosphoglucomutase
MIKAFIFDLDGVIVDTVMYHYNSWVKLADKLGFQLNDSITEKLKGISRMASLELVLEQGGIKATEAQKIEYAKLKNDWYLESLAGIDDGVILDGVKEFLIDSKKHGIKTAIGSASKNAKNILAKTTIYNSFQDIKDGNDVIKTKPDPEVFLKAAAALNVLPEEAVVFEDSAKGITAAIDGGFKCVGIGSAENLPDAHIVMQDLSNISAETVIKLLID